MEQKDLDIFQHDCATCPGFCCFALRINQVEPSGQVVHFESKPAMQPCRYLTENFQCAIWNQLPKINAELCLDYTCFSAGNFIAELCREYRIDYQPFSTKNTERAKARLVACFFHVSHFFFLTLFLISRQSQGLQDEKIKLVFDEGRNMIRQNFRLITTNVDFLSLHNFLYQALSRTLKNNFYDFRSLIDQHFQRPKFIPIAQL